MKKIGKILVVMLLGLFLVTGCSAKVDTSKYRTDYKTLNLDEALKQENIEHDFSSYEETDDQATIYLFRGNGCGYCKKFLTFLNSIVDEYGKYFKVVSYEVWSDPTNSELLKEVSAFLEEDAGGVPYIVIGDQVFAGYNELYDDSIKAAIKKVYNSKDKYDVFEEMEKDKIATKNKELIDKLLSLLPSVVISIIGAVIAVAISVSKGNKLKTRLSVVEKELKEQHVKLKQMELKEIQKNEEKRTETSKKVKTTKNKTSKKAS